MVTRPIPPLPPATAVYPAARPVSPPTASATPAVPRLMERLRQEVRVKHYSICTEQAYMDWVRRFIVFHGKRHPSELGAAEVASFLTHLAVNAIKLSKQPIIDPWQSLFNT